ncbi:MAG: Csu type fimbrial protein [Desulfuromonadaceae bacterium]
MNLKMAVRITQSNGATEKSKPYMRNGIHQKGESPKSFFKKILPCLYSVALLLRVSNAFSRTKHDRMWLYCLIMGLLFWVVLLTSNVYAGCTVSSTSIIFANYDVLSSIGATGTGSITVSCGPPAHVVIAVGASSNSGAYSPRSMKHALYSDTLDYNLYTSPGMIQVWGDGTNGTATVACNNVKKNNTPPIRIYGKITPLQNVPAGSYSDQLVVTVTY